MKGDLRCAFARVPDGRQRGSWELRPGRLLRARQLTTRRRCPLRREKPQTYAPSLRYQLLQLSRSRTRTGRGI
jgi:hypothetical protein